MRPIWQGYGAQPPDTRALKMSETSCTTEFGYVAYGFIMRKSGRGLGAQLAARALKTIKTS